MDSLLSLSLSVSLCLSLFLSLHIHHAFCRLLRGSYKILNGSLIGLHCWSMGEGEEKKEIKEGIKSNSPIGKQSFSLPQKKKGKKK